MKHLISLLIFFTLMSTAGSDESFRIWLAGKFLNKIYTSYDVNQYMERALLDDAQRGKIFKEANGDYNKYKSLVRKYTSNSFEAALKVLMYNKILEHHATSGKNIKEWKAFRIKPEDFQKQIRDLEDEVLKPLLDQRLGIVKARDQFGTYLKENNFPHKEGESNTDIYFRWYNDQKFRLKHELRTREAQKYEAIAAMGHRREIYIRPTESNDFYKNGKRIIEDQLNGQVMSPKEVSKFLGKNPEVKLLIKDIAYLSVGSASLARIKEDSNEKFEAAKSSAIEGITPSLSEAKIKKIVSYERLAAKMAKKYNDSEKLNKKSTEATNKFMETGEYKEIMKAKIYSLAAHLVENKADRSNIEADITTALTSAMEELKKSLLNNETYTAEGNKRLLFEDLIAKLLKDSLKKNLGEKYDGYLKRALNLGVWTVEFDAKRNAFTTKPEIAVEMKPYMSFDTQKEIQNYLKMKEFKRLMENFRERELRNDMEGLFSLDLDGKNQLYGRDAYDWLIAN